MSEKEREERLQVRFNNIVKAVAMQQGAHFAFACACGAYLMAIETAVAQDLEEVAREKADAEIKAKQLRNHLQSFHKYICDHQGVNQVAVLDSLPSFKEILGDIMRGKG